MKEKKIFNTKSDLIVECIEAANELVPFETLKKGKISVTDIFIDSKLSKEIGKKEGNYSMIEFSDISSKISKNKLKKVFQEKLMEFLNDFYLQKKDLIFIVGLGNEKSAPDSLGPLVVDKIKVNLEKKDFKICSLIPGVMGENGIDTVTLIEGIVSKIKPKVVIAIDSIMANSINRLNSVIQISDSGIVPGSALSDNKKELSKDTLNIPVIGVGVPTVVEGSTIVSDTLDLIYESLKNITKNSDKKDLLGLIGELSEEERKIFFDSVLDKYEGGLSVTPKGIDFILKDISDVISEGINELKKANQSSL